jgi:hypothetical protein
MPVHIVGVGSGEAALKQLLLHEFALILLDAQMPDVDGFETRPPDQAARTHARSPDRLPHRGRLQRTSGAARVRGGGGRLPRQAHRPVWVLRAKVSVLVDLWEKNRRVRTQAALTTRYQRRLATAAERVERALALVQVVGDTDAELWCLLEQILDDLHE